MVTITVSAGPNQGKTTIARIIEDALREAGFVEVSVEDRDIPSLAKEPVAHRFEATKKRPVNIKVEQLPTMPELTNERASQ